MTYVHAIIYFIIGLAGITVIDTIGAFASRKLNFNYGYFIILSAALYISIGYLCTREYNFGMAVLINGLLGLYDGSIGLKLSILLKANGGLSAEKSREIGMEKITLMMVFMGFFFALVGGSIIFL